MKEDNLERHITILGWLNIAGAILFMILGVFVFVLLAVVGAASMDQDALAIMAVIGTGVALLMLLLSVPALLAGIGLLKRRNWGRILALIVAVFNLMNFPIGTAIGVYTFWVLLQDGADAHFNSLKTI